MTESHAPMFQMRPAPLGDGIIYRSDDGGKTWRPASAMGPEAGSPKYEEQAEEVSAMLRLSGASTKEDEDAVIVLFATDPAYSRAAIMDGVGRHCSRLRASNSA